MMLYMVIEGNFVMQESVFLNIRKSQIMGQIVKEIQCVFTILRRMMAISLMVTSVSLWLYGRVCYSKALECRGLTENCLHTICTMNKIACKLIIDCGSCDSVVYQLVDKLKLTLGKHHKPCKLSWLICIDVQYISEAWWDVIIMDACLIFYLVGTYTFHNSQSQISTTICIKHQPLW